ncbi:MAG: hypothetical protein N2053_10615 [Chitinispirillaceae bacterium]|nr:hypothetical protein [Chitinispirillaceae bacterium]
MNLPFPPPPEVHFHVRVVDPEGELLVPLVKIGTDGFVMSTSIP